MNVHDVLSHTDKLTVVLMMGPCWFSSKCRTRSSDTVVFSVHNRVKSMCILLSIHVINRITLNWWLQTYS